MDPHRLVPRKLGAGVQVEYALKPEKLRPQRAVFQKKSAANVSFKNDKSMEENKKKYSKTTRI